MENAPKCFGILSNPSMVFFIFALVCLNCGVHGSAAPGTVETRAGEAEDQSVFEESCDQHYQDTSFVQKSSKKIGAGGEGVFAAGEAEEAVSSFLDDASHSIKGLVNTAASAIQNNSIASLLKQVVSSKTKQEPVESETSESSPEGSNPEAGETLPAAAPAPAEPSGEALPAAASATEEAPAGEALPGTVSAPGEASAGEAVPEAASAPGESSEEEPLPGAASAPGEASAGKAFPFAASAPVEGSDEEPLPGAVESSAAASATPLVPAGEATPLVASAPVPVAVPAPVPAPSETAITPSQNKCYRGKTLVPFLIAIVLVALGTWLYIRNLEADPILRALSLGVLSCFCWEFTFSSILVDSYPIADALGMGPGFSGWIIGIFKVGTFVGSIISWFFLRRHANLWRRGKLALVCAMSFQTFNAVLIAGVSLYAGIYNKLDSTGMNVVASSLGSNFIILGRFLQGCGAMNAFITFQFTKLLPSQDRALQQMRLNLAWSLGLVAGPLMSPVSQSLASVVPCQFTGPMFGATMIVSCLIPVMTWFSIAYAYPSLENVEDQKIEKVSEDHQDHWQARTVVIGCSIALQGILALATSQLEAAMVFLLQAKYSYTTAYTGTAAAVIFFGCVVVYHAYYRMKKNYPFDQVLRFLAFAFFFSSILIHPLNWPDGPRLLIGCMLSFPPLIMGGALIFGIMQNHCLPDSYVLNVNNVTLLQFVVNDFFGRGFGPFLSRGLISRWGQQGYAFENLVLGAIAILLLEIIILRRVDRHLYTQKSKKQFHLPAQTMPQARSTPQGQARPTYIIESPKSQTFVDASLPVKSHTAFSAPRATTPPATTSTVQAMGTAQVQSTVQVQSAPQVQSSSGVHVPRRLAEQRAAAAGLGSFPTSPGAVVGQASMSRQTSLGGRSKETLPPQAVRGVDSSPGATTRIDDASETAASPTREAESAEIVYNSLTAPRRGRPLKRDHSNKGSDTPDNQSTETLRLGSWTIRSQTRTPQLSYTGQPS